MCGHVAAPSGQTAWRMELCHFPDCFTGIVFLDVSAVLVDRYKSIKRSFLRFCSIPPSSSCKTHTSADGKHYLSLQKSKQRCLSLSQRNTCVTLTSCSMGAYIGWRSNCLWCIPFPLLLLQGESLICLYAAPYLFNSVVFLQSHPLMVSLPFSPVVVPVVTILLLVYWKPLHGP